MKTAVLAGINLNETASEFEYALNETESLAQACDIQVVSVITQNSRSMDQRTAFRRGKIEELTMVVKELDVDMVIFQNPLRIQVAERISDACGVNVIDRTALILDIFAMRARSAQAKLQVEMARLQYDLPRILNSTADRSGHERGGSAYNRGAGEMRSDLVARQYSSRIAELKKQLKGIEKQRYQDERRRTRSMMKRAALVGYTNAGKSSLMNALLKGSSVKGQEVMEKDMLFATLDTSIRMVEANARKFLLYDTVGFVSDLPHTLIDAFRSTLDAARDADLLIHVIDASDPKWERKAAITMDTLKEIHADDIPVFHVFNKIDLCKDRTMFDGCQVSCLTQEGLDEVKRQIETLLYPKEKEMLCLLPYDKIALVDRYKAVLQFSEMENTDTGILVKISGPQRYVDAFRNYSLGGKK